METSRTIERVSELLVKLNEFASNHSEWGLHSEYSDLYWVKCKLIWCNIWIMSSHHIGHKFISFAKLWDFKKRRLLDFDQLLSKNQTKIKEIRNSIEEKVDAHSQESNKFLSELYRYQIYLKKSSEYLKNYYAFAKDFKMKIKSYITIKKKDIDFFFNDRN